jgi:hypothetical protein
MSDIDKLLNKEDQKRLNDSARLFWLNSTLPAKLLARET